MEPFSYQPRHCSHCRCRIGGDKRQGSQSARTQCAARVKPKPSKPQQRPTQDRQGQVVRGHVFPSKAPAFAHDNECGHGGHCRVYMHDRTSGKVQGTELCHYPAAAPHPMAQGRIHKRQPQRRKQQQGRELHPLGKRTRYQRRRYDRKHPLIHHEEQVWNRLCVIRRLLSDRVQPKPRKRPNHPANVRPKGQTITPQHPYHTDHAQHYKAVHNSAKDVLFSDHPAVEKSQSGGHQHHQCGTYQEPGGIAGVNLEHLLWCLRGQGRRA
ncbi:PilL protein [Candidatus Magnetobacterium bavaricum]|uniref:PilL protein n=1 Tax=Candidatus Magnetobacterium bavaricum TaxID=29290 RepID=A0A0F3GU03_9BACT|nr:PilL protein [Candidatus Magnetobacterium bavaricum]